MCLQDFIVVELEFFSQFNMIFFFDFMFEDCLYFSIYMLVYSYEGFNLLVMVWIYGGVFVFGMVFLYDGFMLVVLENVVVVIIQYCLGVLGFFSIGDKYVIGNWGYLD